MPWELYNWQQLEWYGKVNFLKGGLAFADTVTTVSPTQADGAPDTGGGGFGLQDVFIALGDRAQSASSTGSTSGLGPRDRYPDHRRSTRPSSLEGKRRVQGRAPALLRPAAAAQACRCSG